ncbi:TPA: LysR family transcriptional regulator, partial [Providencia rettgeri]|nr:LysR family transcriptional regulator [Providencia rettgeri]
VNILRFNYDEVDEIVDYDGNTLILSSEQVVSERFSLQKIIENSPLGIYCRKELYEKFHYDLVTLLQKSTWLCDPAFYKSSLMSDLLAKIETVDNKTSVRQMDNIGCCQSFIQDGDFIGIIDHYPEEELIDKSLIYIPLNKILGKSVCYIYKSKSHSSVLNRFMGVVDKLGGDVN